MEQQLSIGSAPESASVSVHTFYEMSLLFGTGFFYYSMVFIIISAESGTYLLSTSL